MTFWGLWANEIMGPPQTEPPSNSPHLEYFLLVIYKHGLVPHDLQLGP